MLQVCDENQINTVLRIVTGSQKALRKYNNGDDDDDEGVHDDSDNEGPLQ